MRAQPFLQTINNYLEFNLTQVEYFMTNGNFRGGWEGWLQANIGYAFSRANPNNIMTREACYSSDDKNFPYVQYDGKKVVADVSDVRMAARADFCISREHGSADTTFIELKCK